MCASQRERRVVVIEHGTGPRCRRVARSTGGREARPHVIGIGRSRVIRLMARIAIRRHRGVVAVHMAGRTGNRSMRARERECSR